MTPTDIASRMPTFAVSPDVQLRQTAFRVALAEAWDVTAGERLLEIGCGQGDMTAVLAARGATVLAVDPGSPDYGAPLTLGEATRRLKATDLGERIEFRLGFDPLAAAFSDDAFDGVAMAHCSWYFASERVLVRTLAKVRPWARRLFFSEWDLTPGIDSLAHFLAVTIQGQIEAFRPESEANVRTPLPLSRVRTLLDEAGWRVVRGGAVDSAALDDGRWEVDAALAVSLEGLPSRLRTTVETQRTVLSELTGRGSLGSYALVAERA